ncbi:hypothetical protein [Croceicoccus marinus]|uniref:Uncharacterized protein n=1 Tax=Croceicoccus marinus TaxID=450378 RepID=A0A1Z1FC37_9SPHN|nr:hypothetical protein [Croceicoccus marinus]ARU16371.1 hypothetical protein A9D14_09440 [Croceicoccus marinus]
MRADHPIFARSPRAPRSVRRSVSERLEDAVLALAGGLGAVTIHREMPWASITFAGTRHTMTLCFTGSGAVDAGEELLARLPDHEFTIPGQLVADAQIHKVEHEMLPEPKLRIQVELLLLEE